MTALSNRLKLEEYGGRRFCVQCSAVRTRVFGLFGALVLDLPLATVVERLPTGGFAIDLGLHVLLLGLTAEADDRRTTFRILLRSVQQEVILRIDFVLVRDQLHHQRCAS